MLTSAGARGPPGRRARDRRRGPRDRRHEARRPPRALSLERLERLRDPDGDQAAAADRPVAPRSGRSTRSPGSSAASGRAARSRSSTPAPASRSSSRSSSRSRTWPRLGEVLPPEQQPGGPRDRPGHAHSIWPAIHPRILELIRAHRSTIVFTNSRRLAERLAQRLNELAGEELVRAHHGSHRPRAAAPDRGGAQGRPAAGARRDVSSLELGIDMGAVDLVIQVESPTSVARGLQRVGRAGHQVGEPSQGRASSRSTAATCSRWRS